jgi:hypothetical protein
MRASRSPVSLTPITHTPTVSPQLSTSEVQCYAGVLTPWIRSRIQEFEFKFNGTFVNMYGPEALLEVNIQLLKAHCNMMDTIHVRDLNNFPNTKESCGPRIEIEYRNKFLAMGGGLWSVRFVYIFTSKHTPA